MLSVFLIYISMCYSCIQIKLLTLEITPAVSSRRERTLDCDVRWGAVGVMGSLAGHALRMSHISIPSARHAREAPCRFWPSAAPC